MVVKNIGYIINESNITGFVDSNIIKEEKSGRVIAEGILQTANERNRNGRFYPSEELFPQLEAPRTKELLEAGYLRAELGHPLSTQLIRQQTIDDSRTCAQFLKLWTEGDNVKARFRGTNNAFGEAFNKDLLDGCKPAWSLRALGTIVNTNRGAEVHNMRLITWDQVIYPSHPMAYTQKIVTESAAIDTTVNPDTSIIAPMSNADVVSFIQSESANLKYVKDMFDFAYSNIVVDEAAKHITLTSNDGDIVVVNLESYITNEIRDYAAKMNDLLY